MVCLQVTLAVVGDCRAAMLRTATDASPHGAMLTVLHRPHHAAEKSRIEAAGGSVELLRGHWRMLPGELAVSRAIGDVNLNRFLSHTPDVHTVNHCCLFPSILFSLRGACPWFFSIFSGLSCVDTSRLSSAPFPSLTLTRGRCRCRAVTSCWSWGLTDFGM